MSRLESEMPTPTRLLSLPAVGNKQPSDVHEQRALADTDSFQPRQSPRSFLMTLLRALSAWSS